MKIRTRNASVRASLLMLLSLLFVMSIMLPVFSVYSQSADTSVKVDVPESTLKVTDLPSIISTQLAEERGHLLRLHASESSLNTIVFRNKDETQTMYIFNHPVKYIDEIGKTRDISLDIADSTTEQGAFVAKDSYVQTKFPRNLYDGITISADDICIRSVPVAPVSAKAAQAYRIDTQTIAYPYGGNTSIEYSLTYSGYKEDIVVSSYTGQTEYQFRLYTGGLRLVCKDGSYYLKDDTNKIRATIGDIIIFTADERNNCMGSMTHTVIRPDEEYLLTIHLDANYLRDKQTAYPIRIDPTIEILYEQDGEGAIEDTTINSLQGSSGSSGSLFIGKRETYGISRVLMKFPGIPEDLVASSDQILKAEVEIRDLLGGSDALYVSAYPFTGGTWNEDSASWSAVNPNSYGISIGSATVSYANGTAIAHRYSISITHAVIGWFNGTYEREQGILLKAPASLENGSTYLHKTFASYNRSSYQPSVSIVYTNPFYSAFEDSSFSVNGSSVTIKGTASLYSSTSNFQLRANCYAYALQTHFDINAPYPIYNGRTTAYLQIPGEFIDKNTAIPITLPNEETYNLTSTSSVLELWEEHIFPISEKNAPPVREYVFLRNTVEFLIKSDLEAMGYSAQFTNSSAVNLPTTASKRLIIMVLGTNINGAGTNDYHFYMQHTDGTWSHKRGNTPVEASNHLSNAEEVLENAQSLKYDDHTFYFYVTMPASRDHCHSDGISDLNCPYTSTSPTTDLAGEYFASAQQIKPLETICASIGYSGDIDTYVLVANTTQYQFHITSEGTNVNPLTMVIYNENGNVLRIETISSSNTGYILSNLQTGIYYIRLFESFPHSVGPYPSYTFSVQYLTT